MNVLMMLFNHKITDIMFFGDWELIFSKTGSLTLSRRKILSLVFGSSYMIFLSENQS